MTVKYLMEQLSKMNPEARVVLHHPLGKEALFCVSLHNDNTKVWLEDASDNDMEAELEARFEYAFEKGIDELDFYMDLLETGITIEMVQECMGKAHANHMKQFCEEHGLL